MADAGSSQIAQVEVYLAVTTAERQGCHGALLSQRIHSHIIGKNNTHYTHIHFLPYTMSPGSSTVSTTAPLLVTEIFFCSPSANAPPTTAFLQTREFSPRMA